MITQDLKGKKLLILGGTALVCDIVAKAKEMAIYTIVTDWNDPSASPAKKIADEYWMESISDTQKLAQLIKEHNVDGIITNYTDSYLPFYARLCEATGLPCLATEKQMEVISNKELSKELCIKHGISVSKRYNVSSVDDIDKLIDVKYPVLTKPVDNSGQRGIYVCLDKDELKKEVNAGEKVVINKNNIYADEYYKIYSKRGDITIIIGFLIIDENSDYYYTDSEISGKYSPQEIYYNFSEEIPAIKLNESEFLSELKEENETRYKIIDFSDKLTSVIILSISFLFLPLAILVMSIIAIVKSKKAIYKKLWIIVSILSAVEIILFCISAFLILV